MAKKTKTERRAEKRRMQEAAEAQKWEPRKDRDRPTPERRQKGVWEVFGGKAASQRYTRDMAAHPIDMLAQSGAISSDQLSAALDYEELYRAAIQSPGIRDSCTIWEPKGFDSDDGNVEAVKRYREFCRRVGMLRESRIQSVVIYLRMPKGREIGQLREDLNEAAHALGKKG